MTFFKKKGVAWAVLIACVLLALFIGITREPDTPAPEPIPDIGGFTRYVDDGGNLLSKDTEEKVARANARWHTYYNVHAAVVTTFGYGDAANYADHAFDAMGLGNSDMILSLTPDGGWYVAYGYEIEDALTDRHSDNIYNAIMDNPDNDKAVDAFLDAVDDFFADELPHRDLVGSQPMPQPASAGNGSFLVRLIALVIVLFALWLLIDAIRYRSYCRRYTAPGMGIPARRYYPVFWGRRTMMPPRAPRRRSPPPAPRPQPPRSSRPSGGFGGSRPSGRPSGGFGGTRTTRSRPSGGFGGSRSGRSSFSGSRSGGSRGGFGGSRGGGRGGRR